MRSLHAFLCGMALLAWRTPPAAACGYRSWGDLHMGTEIAVMFNSPINLSVDLMFALGDDTKPPIPTAWYVVQLVHSIEELIVNSVIIYGANTDDNCVANWSPSPCDGDRKTITALAGAQIGIALAMAVHSITSLARPRERAVALRVVPWTTSSSNGQTAGLSAAGVF